MSVGITEKLSDLFKFLGQFCQNFLSTNAFFQTEMFLIFDRTAQLSFIHPTEYRNGYLNTLPTQKEGHTTSIKFDMGIMKHLPLLLFGTNICPTDSCSRPHTGRCPQIKYVTQIERG